MAPGQVPRAEPERSLAERRVEDDATSGVQHHRGPAEHSHRRSARRTPPSRRPPAPARWPRTPASAFRTRSDETTGDAGGPAERLRQRALAAADQPADRDHRRRAGPGVRVGAGQGEQRPRLLGFPGGLLGRRRRVRRQEGGAPCPAPRRGSRHRSRRRRRGRGRRTPAAKLGEEPLREVGARTARSAPSRGRPHRAAASPPRSRSLNSTQSMTIGSAFSK